MQILMEIVNALQNVCAPGVSKKEIANLILVLDLRGQKVLRTFGFDSKAFYSEKMKNNPDSVPSSQPLLFQAIDAYCESISNEVRRDLLAVASDFSAKKSFYFKISFSDFANNLTIGCGKEEAAQTKARIQEMEKEGYVIQKDISSFRLLDCDANRIRISKYCEKTFGSKPQHIISTRDFIDEIEMCLEYTRYKPSLVIPSMTQLPADSCSDTQTDFFTDEEIRRLRELTSSIKSILTDYVREVMYKRGPLALSNLYTYLYELEVLTGTHISIWKEWEKELNAYKERQKTLVAEKKIQEAEISKFASEMRLFINDVEDLFGDEIYDLNLNLSHFSIEKGGVINLSLGGLFEEGEKFLVRATQDNIDRIMLKIRSVFLDATIISCESKPYKDVHYIWMIHIRSTDREAVTKLMEMGTSKE